MASSYPLNPGPDPPDPHDGGGAGFSKEADAKNHPTSMHPSPPLNAKLVAGSPSLPSLNPTYANMVMGRAATLHAASRPPLKPRFPALSLPARQVNVKDGRPAISFTGAEIGAGEKRFEFSLVAKFTVGRPTIPEIQNAFQHAWPLTGRATISEIFDARHVLIILDSEEDVKTALSSSLHKVGHAYFRLFRWTPDYNPKKESKIATIWVRLTGLPLALYDTSFVEAIVSTFGYFIAVDARTKACVAVKYARACVELDVTQPIPDSVWISLPNDKGFWQPIEIETNLSYCSKCRVHGHSIRTCRKAKVQQPNLKNQDDKVEKPHHSHATRENNIGKSQNVNQVPANGNADDNKEEWNEVKSKRNKKKKSAKVYIPKAADNKIARGNEDPSIGEVAQTTKPTHMAVRGVFIGQNQSGKEAAREASTLAMVPYVGPLQEPSLPKASDEHTEGSDQQSCALEFNDATGQYYHPKAVDHFNSIQEKAGSLQVQGETSNMMYVTLRNKMKLPSGSKHCLPKST